MLLISFITTLKFRSSHANFFFLLLIDQLNDSRLFFYNDYNKVTCRNTKTKLSFQVSIGKCRAQRSETAYKKKIFSKIFNFSNREKNSSYSFSLTPYHTLFLGFYLTTFNTIYQNFINHFTSF